MPIPEDFDITKRPPPDGLLADVILKLVGAIGLMLTMPSAAAAGNAEIVRQLSLSDVQPSLNTPGEATEAVIRGIIDTPTFLQIMQRHGYTPDASNLIRQTTKPLLNVGENIALWRREELDDDELAIELGKLGFDAPRQERLRTLAFQIPGVQDIILFAVREVFDVAQAERFGQLEGVSGPSREAFIEKFGVFGAGPSGTTAAFEAFAKQAGLSPEWSTAFWASHWQLPSVNQMTEMFQRKVITADDLDVGIRALDFTEFWRDGLKAIGFNPLTRVDLRRMHALGLLDEEQLQLRYEELGFSPENAGLMVEFTLEFNSPRSSGDAEKARDLTRTQILKFLRNGLFTEDEATERLLDVGFLEDDAVILVNLEILDMEEERQKAEIKVIKARLDNQEIEFNDAISALDALDLPTLQRDLLLTQFEAERQQNLKIPTLAQATKMLKNGIINDAEYTDHLSALGYRAPWLARFVALVAAGEEVSD